jgi:hypothetical protein
LGGRSIFVVINAGGADVGDLLVKATLTEPHLPDLFQQALRVILTEERAVENKRTGRLQPFTCPPELQAWQSRRMSSRR